MSTKKDDENKDLTRIEDLSEFLHEEDSELDSRFQDLSPEPPANNDELSSTGIELDALDDSPPAIPDELEETPAFELSEEEPVFEEVSSVDEVSFETTEETPPSDFAFEENSFGDTSFEEAESTGALDTIEDLDSSFNVMESSSDAFANDMSGEISNDPSEEFPTEPIKEIYTHTSEKFEDVKTFAQNFSYGQVQGGGNPPYSIIVRNIKFKDDAEDIIELLREFNVVNEQNEKETLMAVELGSLIIPQISEYTAIVLAHKLRRFDLDLEVGLSDEVHPSKSGEHNPRGLLKKDNLKQNKSESLKLSEIDTSIKDIIISTTSSVPGYHVESYIGIQTTFAIVEESELEKLQYVQKTQRTNSELYDFENTEASELTAEKAFKDYQNSFGLLYEDLAMQLKQKAYAQNANALLGINFQLSPLSFERSHTRVSAYQITCSATLAILGRDT